jgi:putative salt-induced outer membrane protein YdiY
MIASAAFFALVAASLQQPAPPAPRAHLTLDLGFVNAAGNSEVTSFNLGEKLTWQRNRLTLTQTAKVLYGATDGSTTTESYEASGRAQIAVASRIGAFALVTFQRDPFAGVASRWFGGPGVSAGLVQTARDTLTVETGLTAQRERNTANVSQSFLATRTAAAFKHRLGTTAFVTENLDWVANLKTSSDQRVNSETALTAPLSRQVALRASYVIRFDNQPEVGFQKTDRILATGVQIAF